MHGQLTSSLQESNRNKKKRHRYIGFVISSIDGKPISREDLKSALPKYCKEKLKLHPREVGLRLTRYNGKEGMVHCYHTYKDSVIHLLSSIEEISGIKVKIKTIGTSGTIKSLNRKFFGNRLKKQHDPDYMARMSRKFQKAKKI